VLELVANLDSLKMAKIQPVIISFSEPQLVLTWIEETNCPFPVYVDLTRTMYKSLGLPRDIKGVMGKSTMRYYGEKSAIGERLPNMGVAEDTQQLGGNATIDALTKKFLFIYPSKTATDRPTLEQILSNT